MVQLEEYSFFSFIFFAWHRLGFFFADSSGVYDRKSPQKHGEIVQASSHAHISEQNKKRCNCMCLWLKHDKDRVKKKNMSNVMDEGVVEAEIFGCEWREVLI